MPVMNRVNIYTMILKKCIPGEIIGGLIPIEANMFALVSVN
jgi:hypothetical protein